LKDLCRPGEDALVVIGPEGDFSTRETEYAKEKAFQPVTLGKSRLRTETAGIVSCHTINMLNGY
jgi:16S rRNA (uracil1498-N3)-methyltransferase